LGIRGSTTTDPCPAVELCEVLSEAEALAGPDASGVLAKGESEPALSSVGRDAFEDELEHSRRELNIARSHVVSGVLLVANTLAVVWRVIDSFTIAENPARSTALAMCTRPRCRSRRSGTSRRASAGRRPGGSRICEIDRASSPSRI
jgi:hypothetical protein